MHELLTGARQLRGGGVLRSGKLRDGGSCSSGRLRVLRDGGRWQQQQPGATEAEALDKCHRSTGLMLD